MWYANVINQFPDDMELKKNKKLVLKTLENKKLVFQKNGQKMQTFISMSLTK